ncbi:C1q and tumor necrosis factor-related protein 3 [Cladochytrium replicatum]|nr:C1q and tumor necrosis factor-related protein 3 [Cladochytrium replicatum]
MQGALSGITVIELAGLAPGPFAGMVLSDFGADVIRVDKPSAHTTDVLYRGKRSISLDLKSSAGLAVLKRLCAKADVVIDPFRPGVMEKMGLGPDDVLRENPKCVYARITGFGQQGPYSKMAGHDINYIAVSGVLSVLGRKGEPPMFPANILGDFAGGGMLCVVGILLALVERTRSGRGQVVDAAMVDGAAYLSTFILKMMETPLWNNPRGENVLDSGAPFYEVYETKDGKYMSVGALEPQFYAAFIKGLGLDTSKLPGQIEMDKWPVLRKIFKETFLTKTRAEWAAIFDGTDACVAPILETTEVMNHPHNIQRGLMAGPSDPNPAPRLSRTPGRKVPVGEQLVVGQHTVEVLNQFGFAKDEVDRLMKDKVVRVRDGKARSKL